MFKRTVKIAWVGLALGYVGSAQASPTGLYGKVVPMVYQAEKASKKENFLASVGVAYQFNRFRAWEATVSGLTSIPKPSPINLTDSNREDVLYAVTFIEKHLVPLKYYFNLYSQWGFSYKNKHGLHAPFVGFGASYYYNRQIHIDFAWRNYSLLKVLAPQGADKSRDNGFVFLAIGYYIR